MLARFHIGGERLTAFLDHAGKVAREYLDIDFADCGGVFGWLIHPMSARSLPTEVARTAFHRKPRFGAWFRRCSARRLVPRDLAVAILAR